MKKLLKLFQNRNALRAIIAASVIVVLLVGVLLGGSYLNDYRAMRAESALAENNYDEALEYMKSYHASRPEDVERAMLLAKIHILNDDMQEARQLLEALRGNTGENATYPFYWGLIDIAENKPERAEERAKEAQALDRAYLPARYLLAAVDIFRGDYENGKRELAKVFKLLNLQGGDFKNYAEEINSARMLLMKHLPIHVERRFAAPFEPLRVDASHFIPTDYYDNLYFLPMSEAEQRVQLSLKDNFFWLAGVAAFQSNNVREARKFLDRFEDSDSLIAHYALGYLLAMEGNFGSANFHYGEVLTQDQDNPDAKLMFANAGWSGNLGAAPTENVLANLRQVITAEPENPAALNNMGYLNIFLNDFEKARGLLNQGLKANPDNVFILLNLSFLNIIESDFAAAEERLVQFQLDNPELPNAKVEQINELILISYAGQHKTKESVALLEVQKELSPEASVNAHLQIAELYRGRGEWKEAAEELKNGAELFDKSVPILAQLLIEHGRERNPESYVRIKSLLEQLDVDETDYRVLLAESMLASSEQRSDGLFNDAVRSAPTPDEKSNVMVYRARNLIRQDKKEKALIEIKRNWNVDEVAPPAPLQALLFRLRSTEEEFTHVDDAGKLLAEVVAYTDARPELQIISQVDLAWAMLELGAPQKVIHQMNSLGQVRFDSPLAIKVLSQAHGVAGDANTAEEVFERLSVLDGGPAVVEQQEEQNAALEVITGSHRDISKSLNDAVTDNDYEKALEVYTQILNDDVKRKEPELTYQNRGAVYLVLKRYEEAAADFQKALEFEALTDENRGLILYNYGYVLAKLGKYGESVDILTQKLDLQPDDLQGYNLLSQVLVQTSDNAYAAEILERLIAAHPNEIRAYMKLANLYYTINNNQIEEAVKVLKKALKIEPKNPLVRRALSDLYDSIGDTENAQKYLETFN